METYRFDDRLPVPSKARIQDTGQLITEGAIARTGVLNYLAKELGGMFADKDPNSVVRVAQLSDDLFSEETAEKFHSAPITIGHPADDVDVKNMKELGVGTLVGKPGQDGIHLQAEIQLHDAEAIELVNDGTKELSVRAYYELKRIDDSDDYEAIRTIRSVNHVAIVEKGRAGATCRLSDSEGAEEAFEEAYADVLVMSDEAATETAEPAAEAPQAAEECKEVIEESIEETANPLAGEMEQLQLKLSEMEAKHDALTAELEAAKAQVLSDEAIEDLVQERIAFHKEVAKLSDADVSGLSILEAKRKVVAEATGMKMDDRDEVYVSTRYQILLEDSETETPMTKVMKSVVMSDSKQVKQEVKKSPAEVAREKMIARFQ